MQNIVAVELKVINQATVRAAAADGTTFIIQSHGPRSVSMRRNKTNV